MTDQKNVLGMKMDTNVLREVRVLVATVLLTLGLLPDQAQAVPTDEDVEAQMVEFSFETIKDHLDRNSGRFWMPNETQSEFFSDPQTGQPLIKKWEFIALVGRFMYALAQSPNPANELLSRVIQYIESTKSLLAQASLDNRTDLGLAISSLKDQKAAIESFGHNRMSASQLRRSARESVRRSLGSTVTDEVFQGDSRDLRRRLRASGY